MVPLCKEVAVDHPAADRPDLVVSLHPGRLAAACAARGWSYKELARRSRLSRPTVNAARRGIAVRPLTAYKILRALQEVPAAVEAAELLGGR
jgi:transcriptional regulator with XRE-family HTH domain